MAEAVSDPSKCPKFHKYERMEDSTKSVEGREIHKIKEWVVLEKIHGANLSLTIWQKTPDTVGVKIARRNDYLKDSERFFGLETQADLQGQLHAGCHHVWASLPVKPDSLTIFGELFGGFYPHPSIPPIVNAISVQKEVAYCPDMKFFAYDICQRNGDKLEYMDYDQVITLLSNAGISFCQPLLIGTFEEAFHYPLGFETKLPQMFGLPSVDNNLAEGVVVKPVKNTVLDTPKGPKRLIFKRKIEKFSERRPLPKPSQHTQFKEPDKIELLKLEMYALMTEQRAMNAISKVGRPEKKQEWEEVKKLIREDILETLAGENEELWQSCQQDPVAMAMLMKEIRQQIYQLVKNIKFD
jgi:Rnl2 family RNA ligase